jgi:hypothetical protein
MLSHRPACGCRIPGFDRRENRAMLELDHFEINTLAFALMDATRPLWRGMMKRPR